MAILRSLLAAIAVLSLFPLSAFSAKSDTILFLGKNIDYSPDGSMTVELSNQKADHLKKMKLEVEIEGKNGVTILSGPFIVLNKKNFATKKKSIQIEISLADMTSGQSNENLTENEIDLIKKHWKVWRLVKK